MAQNIYDNAGFFAAYAQLPRSQQGLVAAPEWPALRAQLPSLEGKRVLDLGCGFGWFARWVREQGASSVLAVDLSERMLERALMSTRDESITYLREDLERFDTPQDFDVAFSSLALHYVIDVARLFRVLRRALTPGGSLVFSVEHPVYTAPRNPSFTGSAWQLDAYLEEGPRTTNWLVPGVVKRHRMVASYLNALIDTGFTIAHVEEWAPSDSDIAAHPDWRRERERPAYLLVRALVPVV